jgi:DNA-directed RNA polymerase I subunit RPA2
MPSFTSGFVDADTRKQLRHITAPHVEGFNFFIDHGLEESIKNMVPTEFGLDNGNYVRMEYLTAEIGTPLRPGTNGEIELTPREARESGSTYSGALTATVNVTIEGPQANQFSITFAMGDLPIMVMSKRCHLQSLSATKLVALKEEANEMGGYFVLNGIERVIRMLQVQRRNYAMAIERSSYRNRGLNYSDKGVAMRCCRSDQTSVTVTLHYLTNGGATLRFVLRKQEFLLPVVLIAKALHNISDQELFNRIVGGDKTNTFLTTRLELLLRDFKSYKLHTMRECQAYLGALFRGSLPISDRSDDATAGAILIRQYIFVHVDAFSEKLDCLIHMVRKLFSFVEGKCIGDNADALMNHELLLPGHLISMYVKEKMEEALLGVRMAIVRDSRVNKSRFETDLDNPKYFQKNFERCAGSVGNKVGTFLSTGNIVSSTGMDLMQVSGYTIVAERLNFLRYMSHFQSVHRGQFFTTMKTTTVRKLLPESWGFLCPVHTPDGGPCGLLNHMAKDAVVLAYPPNKKMCVSPTHDIVQPPNSNLNVLCSKLHLQKALSLLGMRVAGLGNVDGNLILDARFVPVLCDGTYIGGLPSDEAYAIVNELRRIRSLSMRSDAGGHDLPFVLEPTTEFAYLPRTEQPGPYPGLYIFTQAGRMTRPVLNLQTRSIEWIGPMEQVFMEIACLQEDIRYDQETTGAYSNSTTHIELSPTTMLSHIASLTPFSDYNQSPRNMYQCQMGKQTMGTPAHALRHRSDNKLYRIQNVQAPLVQTSAHGDYCMDEYPQGCNAVVAVISYTGYDMEDAMIINKAAYERGFGHGSVYKSHFYDLDEEERLSATPTTRPNFRFSNVKTIKTDMSSPMAANSPMGGEVLCETLDTDGLPFEGTLVKQGDPLLCMVDATTGEHRIISHKDAESAYIATVRVIGNSTGKRSSGRSDLRKVSITLRYRRNPVIGDKFSSRHGQKGTLSVLWPQENMPFSESGMSPDVLINPHAFPSRMTIGMLIESMAGKAGAIHGKFQDSTPFRFHEQDRVIDYMGEQLKACGYHYYGSEPLYNGLTGRVMQADIFMGVVFYQRLRCVHFILFISLKLFLQWLRCSFFVFRFSFTDTWLATSHKHVVLVLSLRLLDNL